MSKTALMLEVESREEQEIEELLCTMLSRHGFTCTADLLGIGNKTLWRWLKKLNIEGRIVYGKPSCK